MQTISPPPPRDRPNTGSENRRDLEKAMMWPTAPQSTTNSIAMIIVTRPDATEEQIDHIVDSNPFLGSEN